MGSGLQAERSGSAHERPPLLELALPVDPGALAGARRTLAHWLTEARVRRRDVEDLLVAAHEACMNAVEHSGTPTADGFLLLARQDGERLRVEVRDHGSWREPSGDPDRGHGLTLMRELTDVLEIEREPSGTTVVMEKTLG